uniref:UV radiation resistance associated protein n=2 Tax=Eukaryota TaxID=2759 RepID=A0A7S1HQQ4_9EUKA|mmetsp:Transcript_41045/g.87255  ORF Transcript_41045/g.87255 Transcript_41045/m.87255 type:complete len:144 (-) Transcript_41045:132-563(-)
MGGRQRNISICGLELDSSVIKKNKDVLMENDNGNNVERLAAALGYVAHIVQLLATYFDIPLRYPVKSNNSRSYVEESTSKNSKFPLYIDHRTYVERERTRFAYAVFLLNKDIEQILNAHGLDAYGVAPHQILNNLHKFLSFSN